MKNYLRLAGVTILFLGRLFRRGAGRSYRRGGGQLRRKRIVWLRLELGWLLRRFLLHERTVRRGPGRLVLLPLRQSRLMLRRGAGQFVPSGSIHGTSLHGTPGRARSKAPPLACVVMLGLAVACGEAPGVEGPRRSETAIASAPSPWSIADSIRTSDVVRTFGWDDLSDSTRGLSDLERQYAGAVLSRVAGIAEGADKELFVLDRGWQKIVVFDSSGVFNRIILGGYGSGPGEFLEARDLATAPSGNVGVLDDASNRVTVFNSDGVVLATIPLSGSLPLSLALDDEDVWVLHTTYVPGARVVRRYSGSGELIDSRGLVGDRIAEYLSHGEAGALAVRDGEVYWALPASGEVRRLTTAEDVTIGAPFFPHLGPANLGPEVVGGEGAVPIAGVRFVPIGVRKVGFSGRRILLYHFRFVEPPRAGALPVREFFLSVMEPDGTPKAHYQFGDIGNPGAAFAVSRDGSHFYVATTDPFPHVKQFPVPE